MSTSETSCPHCHARLMLPPGNTATRFRCTQCKQVFETLAPVPAPPPNQVLVPVPAPAPLPEPAFSFPDAGDEPGGRRDDDEDDERGPRRGGSNRNAKREQRKSGSGGMIALIACVGSLLLVGIAVGGYFVFRDKPKEPAKSDNAKEQPKPPAKKDSPPLTPEQMIRKVKTSTVYVRTFLGDGFGTGSGFFAGKPGFVVTNAHVVGYGPTKIQKPVKLEVVVDSGELGERAVPARLYGLDVEADLALLQLEEKGLPPPLPFGKADALLETQEVVIFGYPFGEMLGKNVSVNRTTVSSLRKINGTVEVVQLAGGMNPGNSGGPVTNAKGEVIGVSVAKLRGTDTIAFAIPAEVTDRFVADQIRAGGEIRTGDLTPP